MVQMPVADVSRTDCMEWCIRGRPQLVQERDGTFRVEDQTTAAAHE